MNRTNHPLTLAAPNGHADPAPATPAPEAGPLLIDFDGLAALLSISRPHLERLESAGAIGPARIKLGRSVRFRLEEVRDWIRCGCPRRVEWTWPAEAPATV